MARIPISKLDGGEVATPPIITQSAKLTEPDSPTPITDAGNRGTTEVPTAEFQPVTQPTFTSVGTVIDQNGVAVPVDRFGRDVNGALVIQGTNLPAGPIGTTGNTGPVNPVPTGTTGSTVPTINPNTVTDYIAAAQQQLIAWGILNPNDPASNDLMNQIKTLAQQGAQTDTIALAIQNSTAYANRFSGNKARVANGLAAYSPKDYLDAENNYSQILNEAGVGQQYQTQQFLANLIGKNVGTSTLQQYVNMASELANTQDPYLLQTAAQQYGLNKGDLIAHFLDPNTALPVIQQQFAATQTAAEAARQNLALSQQNAMTLAAQGITQEQARSGFANIGSQLAQQQQLANMYNMGASNISNVLTAAQFNTNVGGVSAAQAQQELTRLRAQEVNQFSGSSGAAKGSLYTESQGVS
jgi:hypothetical protein